MCGFTGFIGKGNKEILLRMMQTLNHRGPDDEDVYINGNVHLGHKRLSIIDLSEHGRQPISNENDSIWLIFNGEIYNFQSLREHLESKGHIFKSRTDSEVIIHLYEEYGVNSFEKLNGMFAFAIWDNNQQRLLLARDKMGQKPIYYSLTGDTFVFGSEANALLKHSHISKNLNLNSLAKFLFYEHVPTPDCIWEGIRKLNPGTFLVYDVNKKTYETKQYWKIRFLPRLSLKEEDIPAILEEKLYEAIRKHLIADVPVGVYLSGGLDSSTIAYFSQKIMNGKLKTFTIAFEEPTFDEQHKARGTANKLGTEHYEFPFTVNDFIKTTFGIIPKLDEPFADSSFIPAYYLNKAAKNYIKVGLGGEGGDEIFVGYPIYIAHGLLKYMNAIPSIMRRAIVNPFINRIPTTYKNETWTYRMKKFIEAEGYYDNPFYCQQIWLGAFGPKHLPELFKKDAYDLISIDNLFSNIDIYRSDADENEEIIDGLMRQTQHKYLMDDGLTKADRASMLNSIEVRAPLLDGELVDWVNKIPFQYKFKAGHTKIILRNLMKDKLPEEILTGPKRGFTPPIAEWFVKYLQKELKEYLFFDNKLFNENYIKKLWDEHFTNKQNHRKILWTLFIWKLWSSNNK